MINDSKDNGRRHVLVVDDEPLIRWALHAELEAQGYQSVEAESLAQARDALTDHVDVVLLDAALPDGDGMRLLEEIDPDVPVIVLTAHGTVKQAVEAMRRGAFDYVEKPIELPTLMDTLAEALAPRTAANGNGAPHAGNGASHAHALVNGHDLSADGVNGGRESVVALPPNGVVLDEVERTLLAQALERTAGNRSRAARLLGITRNQIRYRIRKFGLDDAQR